MVVPSRNRTGLRSRPGLETPTCQVSCASGRTWARPNSRGPTRWGSPPSRQPRGGPEHVRADAKGPGARSSALAPRQVAERGAGLGRRARTGRGITQSVDRCAPPSGQVSPSSAAAAFRRAETGISNDFRRGCALRSPTEASDGRLARVGRIAASAFMSGAAGLLSGRSRAPVGTAQHVALGNKLATALAMSPQHDYNMSGLCQERKCFIFRDFRRHCNVLPMPRLGRPSCFRS
jgi:hypothetical protein